LSTGAIKNAGILPGICSYFHYNDSFIGIYYKMKETLGIGPEIYKLIKEYDLRLRNHQGAVVSYPENHIMVIGNPK